MLLLTLAVNWALVIVLNNRKQQTKDTSALHKTADALENRKAVEFNVHEVPNALGIGN